METKSSTRLSKIVDGRMMQGICAQWFYDNYGERKEFVLYMKIARLTFGFKKRYAYIRQDEFALKSNALKVHRDWLESEGLISWKKTKGYTMYQIEAPVDINNFQLKESASQIVENLKEENEIEDLV